jgi:hypothetical protein
MPLRRLDEKDLDLPGFSYSIARGWLRWPTCVREANTNPDIDSSHFAA